MASAATEMGPPISLSSDIGNIIEVNNLNDDLGLNLLANQNRIKIDGISSNMNPPSFGSSPIRLSVFETDLHTSSVNVYPFKFLQRNYGYFPNNTSAAAIRSMAP